jgi:hypothetical protein
MEEAERSGDVGLPTLDLETPFKLSFCWRYRGYEPLVFCRMFGGSRGGRDTALDSETLIELSFCCRYPLETPVSTVVMP